MNLDDLKADIHAAVDSGEAVEDVLERVAAIFGPIGIDLSRVDHSKPCEIAECAGISDDSFLW